MCRFIKICFFALLFVQFSCTNQTKVNDETPTRGNIKIGVDNSYKLLLDTEIFTFEAIYNYAEINPLYKPEMDVLNDFINDSVRIMITGRQLTKEENDYLISKDIYPKTTKIAYDAVAFIINSSNNDTMMNFNEVKDIFSGKISSWKDMSTKGIDGKIQVVFDNEKSGNIGFLAKKTGITKYPSNFVALKTNEAVINYVESHENALGIVSVNWISDKDDSLSNSFLKRVKVLAIASEINPEGPDYYRPYAGFIADESYPFIREVYAINRETFLGLGTGFISFIAGEKGQRIILKSGMIPAVMPVRLVKLKKSF